MKQRFEMSSEQEATILEACRPVSLIALQCGTPSSPQENANRAWQKLGKEMGFVWDTVEPIPGEPNRVFNAEPLP